MRSKMLLFALATLPWSLALAAPDPTILSLRQEIAALNVDHALNLTKDQAVALLPILRDAADSAKARRAAAEASNPALVTALTHARDEMRSNGTISDATQQEIAAARTSNAGTKPQLRTQLQQILTQDQLTALKSLKPAVAQQQPAQQSNGQSSTTGKPAGRRGFFLYRAMTSDAFISLVQARAGA
jgi:hypothetical protein